MQNYVRRMGAWDIVLWGRIVGASIIVGGLALSIWFSVSVLEYADTERRWFFFFNTALQWLAYGGFVVLAAEIADRLWTGRSSPPSAEDEEAGSDG